MHHLKTLTFKDGRTLEIHSDDDPESPRSMSTLGTMVCFHKRHCLGDEADGLKGHGYCHEDYNDWDTLETQIKQNNPGCVILPLFLFDHSGISISTTSGQFRQQDSMGWDWGSVGFIFISREKINEEYGAHGGRTDEQIEGYLRSEVEVYDQYLRCDVWGFILRQPPCVTCDNPGEEESSCWGFYGDDPAENGMSDNLDQDLRDAIKKGEFQEVSH